MTTDDESHRTKRQMKNEQHTLTIEGARGIANDRRELENNDGPTTLARE